MALLTDLIGVVDNLGEAKPLLNSRGAILGIIVTFQLATWICVCFRLYTRFVIIKSPWWDDFFVILSAVSRYPFYHLSMWTGYSDI